MRSFPDDLVQAQQEWSATYHRLADGPGRTTELRRRLYRLSTEVLFHPYWRQGGRTPAGWAELRNLGRGGRSRR
ncbi:hypothetical protein [Streptomyces chartreusis]|uniref:hypothetical protein n=1 Tax=Streptomyces chartreusis TaxID=1969 RepID=UPI00123D741A|nr:hypothetical protein [Streptomyces chartreusis]QEV68036.1 hypothetical protein CP983_15965 [Streptomyces chartreusis]GGX28890.1 hypothetical protein GCM10010321_50030 [Streptomyces chartreusis]